MKSNRIYLSGDAFSGTSRDASRRATRTIVRYSLFLCVFCCLLQTALNCVAAEPSVADRHFTLEVLPLLKEKCFGCHGNEPDDLRGDYDMHTRELAMKGGESDEVAIVPGKPEESPVYSAVKWNGMEMPPKENDRLTEEQVEHIGQWIADGAPWPDAETQLAIQKAEWKIIENKAGRIVSTSGGLADEWTYRRYLPEDLWAFQPLRKMSEREAKTYGRSAIDGFVNQKLAEAKIKPAPRADFRTLIRRATYDLTGLPPTPKDVSEFRKAWKENPDAAWESLVDRLLASKHYGERWGQHWLDVVRYADTAGFSNDYERSNAWRYRDYVIRSFNNDKPFNEFVVEQIAGDELRPDDPEAVIATGMLRMGPWGTAMVPQKEARQTYLDDLVHNVGQSFLSMPMRCCKCHDHKFDPLPTRDYYRMYATFATTQPAEVDVAFMNDENRDGFDDKRKLVQELLAFARAELAKVVDKQEAAAKVWYKEHNLPYKNENARKKDPEDMKPPRHVGLTPEEKGIKKVREQDVWIWERRLERYQPMAQAVYNGHDDYKNGRKLRQPKAIRKDWRPENYILNGGALGAHLDAVGPGVLSATGVPANSDAQDPYLLPDELDGRRLAFARWVVSDNNPLSARSIVNRLWQYHFGTGIVKTSNNFGAKGGKPSHLELLDWLSADFVENGWKVKRIHRMIMLSDTYQRSGDAVDRQHQQNVDPNNELLASFPARRITAEELRDATLKVSGELNVEMGGVPIMPEINLEVALQPRMIQFSIAPAHQPSRTPEERNRRTIYTYRVRGQADPFLEVMNLPNPNESCEVRDSASVSPQAFTLMNSDVMTDRSIALALRVQRERPGKLDEQVRHAVQLAYCRVPTKSEQASLVEYVSEMQKYHAVNKPEKKDYPKQVVRSLVEEFTGEPFEFVELLNVYDNYVADPKPWTVGAETRALADACLLLLNSNEFVYVY